MLVAIWNVFETYNLLKLGHLGRTSCISRELRQAALDTGKERMLPAVGPWVSRVFQLAFTQCVTKYNAGVK
jgi:hypothetical protein